MREVGVCDPAGGLERLLGQPLEAERGDGADLWHGGPLGERHELLGEDALGGPADLGLVAVAGGGAEGRALQRVDDVVEPGERGVERILLHEPRGAVGLEDVRDGVLRRDDGGRDGVERAPGRAREELAVHAVPGRPGRDLAEQVARERELGGAERRRESAERRALLVGRCGPHGLAPVAADGVDVVQPAEYGGRGLDLVAVVQVEGDEDLLEGGHRRAPLDGVLAEAVQRGAANLHHPLQLGGGVGAVRPLVGARVHGDVLVGEVSQVALPGLVEDPAQLGRLVDAVREVLIAPDDGDAVPLADPVLVDLGVVERAVVLQRDPGVRVVHDGDAAEPAVVVVVPEAEGVADLVCRELADAGERPFGQLGRRLVAGLVGREQPLGDQVVLPHAQRAERDDALDDLAGARIRDRGAVAPAARRAVHPVDDVVADVERVRVLGEQLDAERVPVPRGLERLVPPARAVEKRRADRLGRARVEVVDDRLDRLAHRRVRVLLLQPVTRDEALRHRLLDRRRVVLVRDREVAGARVEEAGLVAVVRELDERVVHADARGLARRGDAAHALEPGARAAAARALPHEGQLDLHLRVPREVERHRPVDRAAAHVQPVAPGAQAVGDPCGVAEQEVRRIDEHAPAALGGDVEAPEHAAREGVAYGADLGGVRAARAVAVVRLDHEDLRPDALEDDDARAGELPAVDPDVVRAEAGSDTGDVEDLGVEARDLEPELAGGLVPVEREEAVETLHAARPFLDRRRPLRLAAPALRVQMGGRGDESGEHEGETERVPDARRPTRARGTEAVASSEHGVLRGWVCGGTTREV